MRVQGEQARVLVTVKATPQPSEKYGDTSCVAGIRTDCEQPAWVRLYPIAFRWLDGALQFKKYDVIELEVRRRDSDTRKESYLPTQDSWRVVDRLRRWKHRHAILSRIEPTTTCELMQAAKHDSAATSLGLVYPADVEKLIFDPHPKWSPEQLKKMQDRLNKESTALIPMNGKMPSLLKEPRFKVRYRYRCAHSACKGHMGRILDWELTALQNKLRGTDQSVKDAVTKKYRDEMFASDRDTGLYMGNFELAAHRASFSVLGVYWPKVKDTVLPHPTLF